MLLNLLQLWNELEKDTGPVLTEREKEQTKLRAMRFELVNPIIMAISNHVWRIANPEISRNKLVWWYYDEAVKRKNHERDQDLTRE